MCVSTTGPTSTLPGACGNTSRRTVALVPCCACQAPSSKLTHRITYLEGSHPPRSIWVGCGSLQNWTALALHRMLSGGGSAWRLVQQTAAMGWPCWSPCCCKPLSQSAPPPASQPVSQPGRQPISTASWCYVHTPAGAQRDEVVARLHHPVRRRVKLAVAGALVVQAHDQRVCRQLADQSRSSWTVCLPESMPMWRCRQCRAGSYRQQQTDHSRQLPAAASRPAAPASTNN